MSSPLDVLQSLTSNASPPRSSSGHSPQRSRSPHLSASSGSPRRSTRANSSSVSPMTSSRRRQSSASDADEDYSSLQPLTESLEAKSLKGAAGGFQELRALVSIPFFENFDKSSAKKLARCFNRRTLSMGETIVQQGGLNAGFHVLVRGKVDFLLTGLDGVERLIETRSNPAYFGQHTLVRGGLEAVTVRAAEEASIILSIGPKEFEAFIQENPNVRVALEYRHGFDVSPASRSNAMNVPQQQNPRSTSPSANSNPSSMSSSPAPHSPFNASTPPKHNQLSPSNSSALSSSSASSIPLVAPHSPQISPIASLALITSTASPLTPDLETLKLVVNLRELPFFQQIAPSIPEMKLQQLATLFEFRRAPAGECLMREHEQPDGFYILLHGRINVSALGPNHQALHLNTLKGGDFFGELSLRFHTLRTATLTTVQPCTMLYLSNDNFRTFLRLAPEVLANGALQQVIHRRVGSSLKTVPLFSFLQLKEIGPLKTFREDVLLRLGPLFTFQYFPRNAVICREGDDADAFYIIHSGSVVCTTKADPTYRHAASGSVDRPVPATNVNGVGSSATGVSAMWSTPAGLDIAENGDIFLSELGQSDFFGEVSLRHHSRRTATVRTLTDTVLLKLKREQFDEFLAIAPEIQSTLDRVTGMRTAQSLSTIPFFRNIRENRPWSKAALLGSMFQFRHCRSGDVVVQEGEVGNTFFVVASGSVEVSKTIHSRHGSEQVILDVLGSNSWFGEIALIKETIRLATVKCREDSLFLTVTKEKFNKFSQIAPDVVDVFQTLLTHRTANMLRSIPFFYDTIQENKPWSKLEMLCTLFAFEYFDRGVVVMKEQDENDDTNKLYIVSVGSVMATRKRQSGDPESDAFPVSARPSPANSLAQDENQSAPAAAHPVAIAVDPSSVHLQVPPNPVSSSVSSSSSSSTSSSGPFSDSSEYNQILNHGSFFNELSLLRSGVVRPLTITTLEPCVFFTLTKAKFDNFCKVCPELRESLTKMYPDGCSHTELATARAAAATAKPNENANQAFAAMPLVVSTNPPVNREAGSFSSVGIDCMIAHQFDGTITHSRRTSEKAATSTGTASDEQFRADVTIHTQQLMQALEIEERKE